MRKFIHRLLGIKCQELDQRVTLIENIIGIESFMSIGEGNTGSGNVGDVPPDVARFQALLKAKSAGNVGDGNVGDGNVGDGNVGTGNVGGDVPSAVIDTQADATVSGGNVGDGNVGDGNVGTGNVGTGNV